MEKIYVDIHPETGFVQGYGSSPISENCIEISMERFKDYSEFYKCFTSYRVDESGSLVYVHLEELNSLRKQKLRELSVMCTAVIMGRFKVTLDAVDYWFSNDLEAQLNFDKMDRAFDKGRVTYLPWTAYLADGSVTRVIVDPVKFEMIYEAHLNHIQNNISKYRDLLMPMVAEAETSEEIDALHWNMDFTP